MCFLPGIADERQISRAQKQSQQTGYIPVMQVIAKPVLLRTVRNVERADAEVGQKEHLLPHGAETEGKNAALLLSRNAQHQKGKHHAGKGIEEASAHVPDHIFFIQAQPCPHEKARPVFHSSLYSVVHMFSDYSCSAMPSSCLYRLFLSVTAHG